MWASTGLQQREGAEAKIEEGLSHFVYMSSGSAPRKDLIAEGRKVVWAVTAHWVKGSVIPDCPVRLRNLRHVDVC